MAIPGLGSVPDHWRAERARWLLTRQCRATRPRDGIVTAFRDRSTAFDQVTLADVLLPMPPVEEQRRIADFLDLETARIDALMAARKSMRSLLTLRRGRVIEESLGVVAGDHEFVPLKYLT